MALLTWAVLLLAGLTYTHAIGSPTPIGNLRSIAQIEFRLVSTWRQQCVGTIITNYHILSTASCFQTSSNNRRVIVGSAIKSYGGIVREVAIINNHPGFSPNSNEGDLSVVRAGTSWPLGGPEIHNVALVPQNYYLPPYQDLSVSGWGVTAQGGIVPNQYLYTAVLQNKPVQTCAQQYPGRITENMVCLGLVGRSGRDFDPSDTGAPVLYAGYLYGVVSFGSSAANNELPIVAQRMGAYANWVIGNAI